MPHLPEGLHLPHLPKDIHMPQMPNEIKMQTPMTEKSDSALLGAVEQMKGATAPRNGAEEHVEETKTPLEGRATIRRVRGNPKMFAQVAAVAGGANALASGTGKKIMASTPLRGLRFPGAPRSE